MLSMLLATAQEKPKYFIKGFVIGSDTSAPIPLANIQNIVSGQRYVSNRYGAFGIWVNENDTLLFSVMGYHTVNLAVKEYVLNNTEEPIRVKLRPSSIRLRDVNITYNKRRQDSLARRAAARLKTDPLLNDYSVSRSILNASQGPGAVLSALLAPGNKKIQEYEKLQRMLQMYYESQAVEQKYNVNLVMRATGLSEEKAHDLMKFCNIPDYFVLNSNDYDVILAIRNCYSEYLQYRK